MLFRTSVCLKNTSRISASSKRYLAQSVRIPHQTPQCICHSQPLIRFSTMSSSVELALDPFAMRQFSEEKAAGSSFIPYDPVKFTAEVNRIYNERKAQGAQPLLVDGYAPFCKHIFIPNFTGAVSSYLEITEDNIGLLRSDYVARTEKELPVLTRFFPKSLIKDKLPVASHLDIILYSREQINKENAAMGNHNDETAPWGIVSVKPQMTDSETPMQPITMMRNALGVEEGGSGVKLDKNKYNEAVAFWKKNASIS